MGYSIDIVEAPGWVISCREIDCPMADELERTPIYVWDDAERKRDEHREWHVEQWRLYNEAIEAQNQALPGGPHEGQIDFRHAIPMDER